MKESDRRVKRTRKLLQEALIALLAEQTFHAITVQNIAERAEVNRATFYDHFVDKYALLDEVVAEGLRELLYQRVSAGLPINRHTLHLLVVAVMDFAADFHDHCKPAVRDLGPLIESKMQQELYQFLLNWLKQRPLEKEIEQVPQETAALVISWAIFGVGVAWGRAKRTGSADTLADQVVALIMDGLAMELYNAHLTQPNN